jgi:YbbR domain-containing protein
MKYDWKSKLQLIINNPSRKVIALLFAFGLWLFVALDNEFQYEKKIHIEYTQLSDSLVLTDSVSTLPVTFLGRGGSLFSIWAAPPKALCNLRNIEPGENVIPTKDLIIAIGFGDIVTRYLVSQINITADRKLSRPLQVSVPLKGSPKENHAISRIEVLDTVEVTGPAGMVNALNTVMTETLSVQNLNRPITKKLDLVTISPLIQYNRRDVHIEVMIDTAVSAIFTNIPLKLIFTPAQRVSSEKISLDTLIVKGPQQRINQLTKRDIAVKIVLTQTPPGEYEFPATITLPDFIKPVYSHPKRFKVKIY